jgi:hypothetical protein
MSRRFLELALTWRTRAFMFAYAICDGKVHDKTKKYKAATRLERGCPDHPFGLMEGMPGDICFISDMLHDEDSIRLPGFEI